MYHFFSNKYKIFSFYNLTNSLGINHSNYSADYIASQNMFIIDHVVVLTPPIFQLIHIELKQAKFWHVWITSPSPHIFIYAALSKASLWLLPFFFFHFVWYFSYSTTSTSEEFPQVLLGTSETLDITMICVLLNPLCAQESAGWSPVVLGKKCGAVAMNSLLNMKNTRSLRRNCHSNKAQESPDNPYNICKECKYYSISSDATSEYVPSVNAIFARLVP